MRSITLAALLVTFVTPALAANCGIDFQHAYEKGVNNGRADGSRLLDFEPLRHRTKLARAKGTRGKCYLEGYGIGYDNAYADAKKSKRVAKHADAPTSGSNERAYYDDGCHEGTVDAQNSMSMAYERHSDMYDSRFEPNFKKGYNACWKQHR